MAHTHLCRFGKGLVSDRPCQYCELSRPWSEYGIYLSQNRIDEAEYRAFQRGGHDP